MAKNYKTFSYFESRPDVVKIFEDLEAFHDFCRIELRKFDPADLYRKDSKSYGSYIASKRPRKPYQGNKPWPNGVRPKHYNNKKA
jgi:hypothetical protein